MRGFFSIGVEGISKAMNLGALFRTAHAFEASFVFTVGAHHRVQKVNKSDTSKTTDHIPYFDWETMDDMQFPQGTQLVGVELTDDSIELPSFRHPRHAAYVLGPERGDLSLQMAARCDHLVKIPTRFCINVSLAAALVMYDRVLTHGRFADRPIAPGGPAGTQMRERQ